VSVKLAPSDPPKREPQGYIYVKGCPLGQYGARAQRGSTYRVASGWPHWKRAIHIYKFIYIYIYIYIYTASHVTFHKHTNNKKTNKQTNKQTTHKQTNNIPHKCLKWPHHDLGMTCLCLKWPHHDLGMTSAWHQHDISMTSAWHHWKRAYTVDQLSGTFATNIDFGVWKWVPELIKVRFSVNHVYIYIINKYIIDMNFTMDVN